MTGQQRDEILTLLALAAPLAVRLYGDASDGAIQRLGLLALALVLALGWAALFARRARRPLGPGLPVFAATFVVMLPGPVGWGSAALAVSFGAVFAREVFGGRAILPPALIGLVFAVFSFPAGGFEARGVLARPPDPALALACLAAAAVLAWRGAFAWQVAAGAVIAAVAGGALTGGVWWAHPVLGAFAPGVLFLAAAPESAVAGQGARWLHGLLVGAMVVMIRLANPDHPDGVVFAVLLGALFAPLFDRALGWRPRRA